jgi:hypothetical protein
MLGAFHCEPPSKANQFVDEGGIVAKGSAQPAMPAFYEV